MSELTVRENFQSTGDGEEIHTRWLMPEEFFEFPLDFEDLDATAQQLLELAERVLPGADPELQIEWAAMCAANYDTFAESDLQYAGFCVAELEGERCTASVNVSVFDLEELSALNGQISQRPIDLISSALRQLGLGEVSEVALPCGPAVSCIGTRKSEVSGELTESGQDEPLWQSFIQVQIPLTNGTVIVMEMNTPSTQAWDVFSKMFAGIVRGIRFFDSGGNPVVMPE